MPSPLSEKFGSVKPSTLALVYYKITEKGTSVLKEDRCTQKGLQTISTISISVQNLKTVLTKYKISDETDEVKQFEALPLRNSPFSRVSNSPINQVFLQKLIL